MRYHWGYLSIALSHPWDPSYSNMFMYRLKHSIKISLQLFFCWNYDSLEMYIYVILRYWTPPLRFLSWEVIPLVPRACTQCSRYSAIWQKTAAVGTTPFPDLMKEEPGCVPKHGGDGCGGKCQWLIYQVMKQPFVTIFKGHDEVFVLGDVGGLCRQLVCVHVYAYACVCGGFTNTH